MFRKSSAVLLLLWLLVAPFFFQIEGNSTIPLPKVSFKIQERLSRTLTTNGKRHGC